MPALFTPDLVPSWNRQQVRFMAVLESILQPLEDMNTVVEGYDNAFAIDSAVGVQLDYVGALLGISRVLPFAPISGSRTLGDADFRLLIRARVAQDVWDGTNEGAQSLFDSIFPSFGIILKDGQDCSIQLELTATENISDIQLEMLNAGLLVPIPAGVSMTYEVPTSITGTTITVRSGVYEAGNIVFSPAET